MKATITSVRSQPSRFGGIVYLITFSCDDGKSRRSCLDPKNGNFERWKDILTLKRGTGLDGLMVSKKDNALIDADSFPKFII